MGWVHGPLGGLTNSSATRGPLDLAESGAILCLCGPDPPKGCSHPPGSGGWGAAVGSGSVNRRARGQTSLSLLLGREGLPKGGVRVSRNCMRPSVRNSRVYLVRGEACTRWAAWQGRGERERGSEGGCGAFAPQINTHWLPRVYQPCTTSETCHPPTQTQRTI